jgi:predicted nucleotidyltransferase
MAKRSTTTTKADRTRWYRGAGVPMVVIRRFAREVAEKYQPEKIILFGSYAYGQPHADSDVDILVVMPARNEIDQAVRIDRQIDPPFPLDLIVRKPQTLGLAASGRGFLPARNRGQGQGLYEKKHESRPCGRGGLTRGVVASRRLSAFVQNPVSPARWHSDRPADPTPGKKDHPLCRSRPRLRCARRGWSSCCCGRLPCLTTSTARCSRR